MASHTITPEPGDGYCHFCHIEAGHCHGLHHLFTTPGEKTGCSLGKSTLVRKEPWEGQPWGNVRNVQGETHHVLYWHPLSCCPCARSTEASGLLLSSQKRVGLGRHRTLAPENEGHFQEVGLSLKLSLIGGRDPGMTSSCSNLEVSGSVPREGSREGVGISACIFWCAW